MVKNVEKLEILEQLYEGKAKKVFKTSNSDIYLIQYKDDATAFNGLKKGIIENKGIVNNKMSGYLFKMLKDAGIPTHFIKLLSDREMLVHAVKIIPLEVIVRNISAGSLSKKLGIEEGITLKTPVFELCYKDDSLGDPMINDYHVEILELATKDQLNTIMRYASEINTHLKRFFIERKINLVDFKLEFGLFKDEVILADEISPDTCRLWDLDTNKKLDKDRFRRDLGDVSETYQEVLVRVTSTLTS